MLFEGCGPQQIRLVHYFDVHGVCVADHDDGVGAVLLVDEFDVGNGVFDQVLRFESVVVILGIVGIVVFHALEEALAASPQQLEWLNRITPTEQFMRTL